MKKQALFSLKDKSKKLKCRLLQFLLGALRVKEWTEMDFASSTTCRTAENRTWWKGIVVMSSVMPQRPSKIIGKKRKKRQSDNHNEVIVHEQQ